MHVGVDADSGLVHAVIGTATNVRDITVAHALLHGATLGEMPRQRLIPVHTLIPTVRALLADIDFIVINSYINACMYAPPQTLAPGFLADVFRFMHRLRDFVLRPRTEATVLEYERW